MFYVSLTVFLFKQGPL